MTDDPAARPALTSPLWYLWALLLALATLLAGVIVAAGAWQGVSTATVAPLGAPAETGGNSLAVYTDQFQTGRKIGCRVRPVGAGKSATRTLDPAPDSTTFTNTQDGTTWTLVATLADPGATKLVVACKPGDGRSDTATYGWAAFDGATRAIAGDWVIGAGIVSALALAGAVTWRNSRWRRGIRGTMDQ